MATQIWRSMRRTTLSSSVVRNSRLITIDSRNRLSNFWAPTGGIASQDGDQDDALALLIRAGYLRQAHSGVFHLLPLGLRVQNKLEVLIDKHMSSIGASKLSLSTITTEALWRQSGRYSANSELLRIKDRRNSGFLLSPTHEEEITAIAAGIVQSYKDLPLRVYQIGRKYRDERRPRQGLLRAKEFLMKDLYTFDSSHEQALETYNSVRTAYDNVFKELKIPYLVAHADSGNMGGKLSHEYHFVSPKGEDNVWSCNSCDYVANEELVEKRALNAETSSKTSPLHFTGISVDRTTAIHISVPRPSTVPDDAKPGWEDIHAFVNLHAVKTAGIDIDTGVEPATLPSLLERVTKHDSIQDRQLVGRDSEKGQGSKTEQDVDITPTLPGAACTRCEKGKLDVQKAIEVAHTFHLGSRYSEPLNALIAVPNKNEKIPIQMGCHGIGLSRIIGASASLLSTSTGVAFPASISPFTLAVVSAPQIPAEDVERVYDTLSSILASHAFVGTPGSPSSTTSTATPDVIIDDRADKSLGWKLKDADLVGYPIVVVLGRDWKSKGCVEVQCRALGVKQVVELEYLEETMLGEMVDELF